MKTTFSDFDQVNNLEELIKLLNQVAEFVGDVQGTVILTRTEIEIEVEIPSKTEDKDKHEHATANDHQ